LNASDDRFRAKELMKAFENPEIGAIVFARGGESSDRLLPYLDARRIKRHKKIVLGYSDLCSILSYLVEQCEQIVYHGLMASESLGSSAKQRRMIQHIFSQDSKKISLSPMQAIHFGKAEGILKGGCLSVLHRLLKSDFAPSFKGSILFLEDIRESTESLSRMLRNFENCGRMKQLKGVLFGQMLYCGASFPVSDISDFMPLLERYFLKHNIPVGFYLPSGHGDNSIPIPLGAKVQLSIQSQRSTLTIMD
jgi:muramoyltetrapeptide carboxypeptidase